MIDGEKGEGNVRGQRGEGELELNPDLDASVKIKKRGEACFYISRTIIF